MPVKTGYKIGVSLNPDAKTISNIRNATLTDYVAPSHNWNVMNGSVSSASTGNSTWGRALPNCLRISQGGQANLQDDRPTNIILFENNTAITVMMRVRFPILSTNPSSFTILFNNGDPNGVTYQNNFVFNYVYDGDLGLHTLSFGDNPSNGNGVFTNALEANVWYHIAVTGGYSIDSYQLYLNGSILTTLSPVSLYNYDTISCLGFSINDVPVDITDFVVLTKVLTPQQIANYAAAPFI